MLDLKDYLPLAKAALGAGALDTLSFAVNPQLMALPYNDVVTREVKLCAAYAARVVDSDGEHTVVLSYGEVKGKTGFSLWCSDKFLEGRLDDTERDNFAQEAAAEVVQKKRTKVLSELKDAFGLFEASDACSFWRTWRKDKALCNHTNYMLARIGDVFPDFDDKLREAYEAWTSKSAASEELGEMNLDYLAFKVPVLFEGDRGAGKTVEARTFCRKNGYHLVEQGGHESLESADLLGFMVPYEAGRYVWKDGPIAEAFRHAKTQKTVLILDELLRIRQRELSVLLTALSPDQGVYRIRTGRMLRVDENGVGEEETLECPVENLAIIATTNVGAEYAVEDIDPAIGERFVVIRKDTSEKELRRILGEVAKARGFSTATVEKLMRFYVKVATLQASGLCRWAPTTRTLVRALELSQDDEMVPKALRAMRLLWVARSSDGKPVQEQLDSIDSIVETIFN